MRKIFIKDICNILLLSLIHTYKYELTLMVGKSCLATLGSANSFGIRVCALTLKGRSAKTFPESFRGADVAHGFFYKAKILCTTACFPISPQRGINYPPTYVGPPFFQERSFVLQAFLFLAFAFLRTANKVCGFSLFSPEKNHL